MRQGKEVSLCSVGFLHWLHRLEISSDIADITL